MRNKPRNMQVVIERANDDFTVYVPVPPGTLPRDNRRAYFPVGPREGIETDYGQLLRHMGDKMAYISLAMMNTTKASAATQLERFFPKVHTDKIMATWNNFGMSIVELPVSRRRYVIQRVKRQITGKSKTPACAAPIRCGTDRSAHRTPYVSA